MLEAEFDAHIAQSVEHILGKDEVTGSIPVMSSIFGFAGVVLKRKKYPLVCFCF